MREIITTKLNTPYVSVNGSYGGNQSWFQDINNKRHGKTIKNHGCGLIGASDILLHLHQGKNVNDKKSGESKPASGKYLFDMEEYKDYTLEMERKFFHILPWLGISGILLMWNINLYFLLNRKRLKEETGGTFYARCAVLPRNILKCIREMLSNDIPVILAIGPGFFRKNKVIFYNMLETREGTKHVKYTFKPATKTKDHYVTVTGIIECKGEDGEDKVMLEISSWGRKYYVNYDEYLEYVKKNDNFYFSNILYIKKKNKYF